MMLFKCTDVNTVLNSKPVLNGDTPLCVEIEITKETVTGVQITSNVFAPSLTIEVEASNKEDAAAMFVEAFKTALVDYSHCSFLALKHITLHLVVNTGDKHHIWYAWAV